MAFCTKCGKELRDGDKFCFNCGEPVRNVEAETKRTDVKDEGKEDVRMKKPEIETPEIETPEMKKPEIKTPEIKTPEIKTPEIKIPEIKTGEIKNKKVIAGGIILALIVVVVIFHSITSNRGEKDTTQKTGEDTVQDVTDSKKAVTSYTTYSNDTVGFSIDYPESYMVTEPDSNNVLITEGEDADFQVSVEYAYHTVSNSAIYSAQDFANQVEDNPDVLTDWLGTKDVQVTNSGRSKIAGKDCYEYDFELEMKNSPHKGQLFIVDGDGKFGCYSFMSVVNEDSEKAELYKEQCEAMKESFQITEAYQKEGYTAYNYDEINLQFMVRDEAMGSTKISRNSVVVYPVDRVFTEANIWIKETSYKAAEKDVDTVLEGVCRYYFKYYDKTQYTSQPTLLQYGRYPCTEIDLEYYDDGKKMKISSFVFVHNEKYWNVTMKSSDEYYDTVSKAASDILFSLKFDGETKVQSGNVATGGNTVSKVTGEAVDSKSKISEIINDIEGQSGYVSGSAWKPLAVTDDFNGDGIQEFLAVYEVKKGAGVNVMYELWSLGKERASKIKSDVLFTEVGGNSGIAGIVQSGGKNYLAVLKEEPEGEKFNNYYMYFPWETNRSALGDGSVYLESHGTYGQEAKGRYILGDTAVNKSAFDARYKELSNWVYKIDLLGGAKGDIVSFDDMKK